MYSDTLDMDFLFENVRRTGTSNGREKVKYELFLPEPLILTFFFDDVRYMWRWKGSYLLTVLVVIVTSRPKILSSSIPSQLLIPWDSKNITTTSS